MSVDVSVLIVSYNTRHLLDECLTSILAETRCAHEIIVVDNASTDGSANMVRRRYPDVMVIENERNVGFAVANNQASQFARGRYLFCLNPDTIILSSAIDQLVEFLDLHPTVGVCGPRNVNARMGISRSCYTFPTVRGAFLGNMCHTPLRPLVKGYHHYRSKRALPSGNQIQDVDAVRGCSLLIRADLYRRLGGMDEGFFLYFEEIDLCYRVKQAHYSVVHVPQATVLHYGAASSGSQDTVKISDNIGIHNLRSRYHYLSKTHGRGSSLAMRVIDLGTGLALLVDGALRREPSTRAKGRVFCMAALGQPVAQKHADCVTARSHTR
jgi:GT2 family glycosyltransferase